MEKPTNLPMQHPATGVMQQAGQSPVTNSTETLAQVTVASRIPEFWREQPRLWFVQFEAVLTNQKFADDAKYNLLVAKLNKESIQQISDIILNPPAVKKYEVLKERLLTVYEESEIKQVQKLLSDTELGDQKPSQLLRKMRDLARNKFLDDTLRISWSGHLPSAVRAVLSVSEITDLDKLAVIAD